jgi:hypothetical protein
MEGAPFEGLVWRPKVVLLLLQKAVAIHAKKLVWEEELLWLGNSMPLRLLVYSNDPKEE